MNNKLPLIGGHVSAAGGLYKAIENATRIGAECIQIFGASPRQWYAKMPTHDEVVRYKDALKTSKVKAVFLHAAYLVNCASPEADSWNKSVKSLSEHLAIAEMIGAQGLIFHIGTAKNQSHDEVIKKVVGAMKEVLENVPGHTQLIMENAAGSGQKIGTTAQEMGDIFHALKSSRVKVCIDTAHAFESGTIEDYTPGNIKKFLDEWDRCLDLENIVALHANDSKTATHSHHDRHENIGEGYIGLKGFKSLAVEKRLHDKSWILEVPGFDDEGPDKKNVEILRGCF